MDAVQPFFHQHGLANAGRAITEPGGMQVGQTFETVIDNPSTTHFFRGWTISFNSGNNNIYPGGSVNNPPGEHGACRVSQAYHIRILLTMANGTSVIFHGQYWHHSLITPTLPWRG